MRTLTLKKTSTRRPAVPRSSHKATTRIPAMPRHLGGTDAASRLQQMQEDMDRIAGIKP